GPSRYRGQMPKGGLAVAGRRPKASADGGAAQWHDQKIACRGGRDIARSFDGRGIAAEGLAQRHRLRRLQTGPSQPQDVRELGSFRRECGRETIERLYERLRLLVDGELEGSRYDVVRGLPAIDI